MKTWLEEQGFIIEDIKKRRILDLRGNQLTEIPPEIAQLEKLRILDLDNNQLTSLPPEIGQLKRLEELYLNGNRLTSFPPEIGQLKKLEELSLNGNQLTSLPPEIGQLKKLEELHLNNNRLTSLPPEIGQLKKLERLYLRGNQLAEVPWCPEEKEIIGWKKVFNKNTYYIAKLLISANAKKHGYLSSFKCKTEAAKVLKFYNLDRSKSDISHCYSYHDPAFRYEIGKIVRPEKAYNGSLEIECCSGIHFFHTFERARDY